MERTDNLIPRVSHLTAPWDERGESVNALAPGGGKMTLGTKFAR